MLKLKFNSLFLKFYRFLAFGILFGTIAIMLIYLSLVAFHTINNTWVAPIIISPTNDKMLRLKAELFNANQSLDKINAEMFQLENTEKLLKAKRNTLTNLYARLGYSISSERSLMSSRASNLKPLLEEKIATSDSLIKFSKQMKDMEQKIDSNLEAGLITRDDAVKQKSSIIGLSNNATDSVVQAASIDSSIKDMQRNAQTLRGGNQDIKALEAIAKKGETQTQIAQIDLDILSNRNTYANLVKQKIELTNVINTLKRSPYFKVATQREKADFAFVPYDNQKHLKIGSPLYDCYLHMIVCKKVGQVSDVYGDEEVAKHFLLKTDLRGSLIQLTLDDKSSAKSKVLFINGKPLLF